MASLQGHFELAHCFDAESIIYSSTILTFSFSLVLGAPSVLPSNTFD
jgi:hypothetical protein